MQKVKYLDGLRGLAALVVVLSHFSVGFYPASYTGNLNEARLSFQLDQHIAGTPINVLYNGNFAVCIFFILSGFVLSYKYFNSKDIKTIISSAFRRYFRLLIPVLFSIIVVYILMKTSLFLNKKAANFTVSTWLSQMWSFVPNFIEMVKEAFFDVFFSHKCNYNPVLWTMTYEFYGSFLVFIVTALCGKFKIRYFIYIILCCLLFNSYYFAFILGLILSDLKCNGYLKKLNSIIVKALLLFLGLFLGSYPTELNVKGTMYNFLDLGIKNSSMIYHIIGALLIMVLILTSENFQRFFSRRIFNFLGKISFSMYVIHLVVIGTFSSFLFISLYKYVSYSIAFIITFICSLIVIFILSFFINKYIDEKGILITKKIYSFIEQKFESLKYKKYPIHK